MRKIELSEICAELYECLYLEIEDEIAPLNFETFRRVILTSGLLSTNSTIKNKWIMLESAFPFRRIRTDAYLVNIPQLRLYCGIKETKPAPGDYIIQEAVE